jgi:hypothetical protein
MPGRPRRRSAPRALAWPVESIAQIPALPGRAPAVIGAPITHGVAKCRWCGGKFRFIDNRHWVCTTSACADRQLARAMRRAGDLTGPTIFVPLPLQVDCDESPIRNLLIAGAAGVSKSTGCRWSIYNACREVPGFRALLLRVSYDQLYKNHLQYIPYEVLQLGDADYKDRQKLTTFYRDSGADSKLFSGYCDVDADIAQHMGPEFDYVGFDEATGFLPRACEEISTRARGSATAQRTPRRGIVRLFAMPGGRAMRHLVTFYIKKNPNPEQFPKYDPADYGYIPCNLEDNPFLPEDYDKKTLSGLSAARYQQLRYGDWTVLAGQFFETFDPAIHLASEVA